MNSRLLTRTAVALAAGVGIAVTMSGCSLPFGVPMANIGDCVDSSQMDVEEVTEITVVDCSEEHDMEVVHTFEMPDGDFPGESDIETEVEERCISAFEEYVGIALADSALDILYLAPSESSWNGANDRAIICLAFAIDQSTTTESYQDSGL